MTHMTAVFSQLSSMENVNNVSMELNVISHQVNHVTFQLIIWKFNKEPDYPPPDQWGWTKDAQGGWLLFWTKFGKFWMPCDS